MLEHQKSDEISVSGDSELDRHFFICMDQVNRAILGTDDLEVMMRNVLETVLAIFACERSLFIYPCDPHALSWSVPMECTIPDCPDFQVKNAAIPMDEYVADWLQVILDSPGPVTFGTGNGHQIEERAMEEYGIRSFMAMAIYPKADKPWQFGIQQCSRERIWSAREIVLFGEIGKRLAGGLSLLLTFRDLKESEASYSRFVNLSNEGVWGLDAGGKTSFANARMAQMLGYTIEEMMGHQVIDFMFDEDVPDYLEKMSKGFKGVPIPYERRYRRKNGEMLWALVAATGIHDEEGNFIGGFGMVTDITEKRRAEEDLRSLNEELEARVIERTQELQESHVELEQAYQDLKLAHASLLQQEKMASIGQLASGIAHEINTPTQYVNNNISFLSESLEDLLSGLRASLDAILALQSGTMTAESQDDLQRLLEEIDYDYMKEEIPRALEEAAEGVRRIANIVVAMKEFSHPSGKNLEPVNLENLIQNTIEITRNSWKMVAELMVEPATRPLVVNGLRDELGQVLLNLIINAVDAIDEARREGEALGRIRIQTRAAGEWAEIVVEDTGCGIPPELQTKIFEPFFTTKSVGRGSGQGLAIAYHIIKDKHGGELRVDSSPDRGSTFTIRLPLATST